MATYGDLRDAGKTGSSDTRHSGLIAHLACCTQARSSPRRGSKKGSAARPTAVRSAGLWGFPTRRGFRPRPGGDGGTPRAARRAAAEGPAEGGLRRVADAAERGVRPDLLRRAVHLGEGGAVSIQARSTCTKRTSVSRDTIVSVPGFASRVSQARNRSVASRHSAARVSAGRRWMTAGRSSSSGWAPRLSNRNEPHTSRVSAPRAAATHHHAASVARPPPGQLLEGAERRLRRRLRHGRSVADGDLPRPRGAAEAGGRLLRGRKDHGPRLPAPACCSRQSSRTERCW